MTKDFGKTTYATRLLWNEETFEYNEYVENCTRSEIIPEDLNQPPLSILLSVRTM